MESGKLLAQALTPIFFSSMFSALILNQRPLRKELVKRGPHGWGVTGNRVEVDASVRDRNFR